MIAEKLSFLKPRADAALEPLFIIAHHVFEARRSMERARSRYSTATFSLPFACSSAAYLVSTKGVRGYIFKACAIVSSAALLSPAKLWALARYEKSIEVPRPSSIDCIKKGTDS